MKGKKEHNSVQNKMYKNYCIFLFKKYFFSDRVVSSRLCKKINKKKKTFVYFRLKILEKISLILLDKCHHHYYSQSRRQKVRDDGKLSSNNCMHQKYQRKR